MNIVVCQVEWNTPVPAAGTMPVYSELPIGLQGLLQVKLDFAKGKQAVCTCFDWLLQPVCAYALYGTIITGAELSV